MLVLYDFGLSPFAQKVKIALREKNVTFERRNGFVGEGADEVHRLSRRGEVPLLVDGETVITDSTIIVDYIEEKWPEPSLLPVDPGLRAESRMLEEFCDTELEANIYNIGELLSMRDGPEDIRNAVMEFGKAELKRHHMMLSAQLGDKDFFNGPTLGRADLSVIPHLNASRVLQIAPEQENVLAWLDRMNARQSVIETVVEVKQSLFDYKEMLKAVQAGTSRRQYRDHRLDWLLRAGGAAILEARMVADNVRFSVT